MDAWKIEKTSNTHIPISLGSGRRGREKDNVARGGAVGGRAANGWSMPPPISAIKEAVDAGRRAHRRWIPPSEELTIRNPTSSNSASEATSSNFQVFTHIHAVFDYYKTSKVSRSYFYYYYGRFMVVFGGF